MKKERFYLVAACLLAGIMSSDVDSQEVTLNRGKEVFQYKSSETGAPVYSRPAPRNEISARALKDFNKTYGEVSDAKWYSIKTGFVVCFTDNGIKTSVFYSRTGAVDSRILYYAEDKLPAGIRHLVKSNFYDYTISFVNEVHKDGVTAFLVKIRNNKTLKTVKVIGGEWEVIEEYRAADE